jgi:DNA polymerase III delta prime subunit
MDKIKTQLLQYISANRIPNILFHGTTMSIISVLIKEFIGNIYKQDTELIKSHVFIVNCGYGKGIKFIREELIFFAKTYINNTNGMFKSIVLLNADKLTIDAQSALRRCIEIFSHTTRFFMAAVDKHTILHPILSRFCEIYILNTNNLTLELNKGCNRFKYLKNTLTKLLEYKDNPSIGLSPILKIGDKLYQKAYGSTDIINMLSISDIFNISPVVQYELLMVFHKIKKEFRCEEMLLFFMLYMMIHPFKSTTICNKI